MLPDLHKTHCASKLYYDKADNRDLKQAKNLKEAKQQQGLVEFLNE